MGDIALKRGDPKSAFSRTKAILRGADLAFANLELPLSERGTPARGKEVVLRGPPPMVEGLLHAGLDVVSFANNHALDYGEEAFEDTLRLLAERGIAVAGAGRNLNEARRPAVLERRGLRVGFLAYSSVLPPGFAAEPKRPGVAPLRALTAYRPSRDLEAYPGVPALIHTRARAEDLAQMVTDVRALRRRADLVVVSCHWGTSMQHGVREFQQEIGRAAVEAGADLVLGGHPHVLQGIEVYRGKPIVYSFGNFIFDFPIPFFTEESQKTFLLTAALVRGGARKVALIPARINARGTPEPLSPRRGAGREVAESLAHLSEPFGTRFLFRGDRLEVDLRSPSGEPISCASGPRGPY
ncbi:MAG: CapA family protein [Nitrospinota bacterium]